MTKERLTAWLRTWVDVYAQLDSESPPFIAVDYVSLEIPSDIVQFLKSEGVVYETPDGIFFHYSKKVQVPIKRI